MVYKHKILLFRFGIMILFEPEKKKYQMLMIFLLSSFIEYALGKFKVSEVPPWTFKSLYTSFKECACFLKCVCYFAGAR